MCLTVDFEMHPNCKPRVARKNISCYKLIELDRSFDKNDKNVYRIIAPYRENDVFITASDTRYKADEFQTKPEHGLIMKAIHSFRENPITTDLFIPLPHSIRRIMCAYIPKGTKYWIGIANDYASECICFM